MRCNPHDHAAALTADETAHYYLCSVCGDKKDEAAHVFDKTAAALTDIQDLSKNYDKAELADPTYVTNSDGAVTFEWYQGSTKLGAKPVNAGTYKVKEIIPETATYTGVSAEKEFTIAKRAIWAEDVAFVYDGSNAHYGDYAVSTITFQNVVSGDTINPCDIVFEFESKDVDSRLAAVRYDDGITANYEFDLSKCSASIVKKVLGNLSVEFTYNGESSFETDYLTEAEGIIASDVADGFFIFVRSIVRTLARP